MEIVRDNQQLPIGVFLSLTEWNSMKHGVNATSPLYKLMDELSQRDIFDLDAAEFSAHLAPTAQNAALLAFEQDLYISYPANIEELPGAFIHEYKNGKKILVRIDAQTGKEEFIKNL